MPGEVVVGELVTKLTADTGDYQRGMHDARDEMDKTADTAGKLDGVMKGAVAGFAIMATAAAAGAVKLFELGSSFDDAYDRIRTGTGKTGEALEALQEDFRQVAANVPASFDVVSTAISELHSRTGLVGPELQNLSTQLIQFSRVTGTDLSQNIALSTRMFGDWSIATDQQAGAMDKVMRASQASGIATDRLMQLIVQFGGPLRQFGFSFEESAAMLSKWEKEGVNVELVMGSMRIAIGHFAREGVDLREGLTQTIEKIKGMEDGSQAAALAMQVFGARAGPDMAAAIREGRFDFEEYLDVITNGADTVLSAAEDTEDAAEKWAKFGNRVALALEAPSKAMFQFASDAADKLLPAIMSLIEFAEPLARAFGDTLAQAFGRLGQALEPVGKAIQTTAAAMKEFMDVEGLDPLTAGLQALRDTLYTTFGPETAKLFERVTEGIGNFFKALGDGLKDSEDAEGDMSGFVTAVEKVSGAINGANDALAPFIERIKNELSPALQEAQKDVNLFRENLSLLAAVEPELNPLDQTLKALALTIGQTFGPEAQSAFEGFTSALGTMNSDAKEKLDELGEKFSGLIPLIGPAFETIKGIISGALGEIRGWFEEHSAELQSIVTSLWNILKGIVEFGMTAAFAPIKVVLQALGGDFEGAFETIGSVVGAGFSLLGTVVSNGMNIILNIIKGAIGEWLGPFTTIGAQIADGVAAGIASAAGRAAAAARNLVQGAYDAARAFIQPGSPSHLFRDQVGLVIGEGIAVGIDLSSELVMNSIGRMSEAMLKEAWRPAKSDQFGQIGHDLIVQMTEGMEKGTPTAIQAVEKTGVAIQAYLKKVLNPEDAERLGGQLIAAIGEGMRGNPEGLIAVGETLDEIKDRIESFAHEKHGEKIAQSLADSIASPSSKEKLRRAGEEAMLAWREVIENETDATVANAAKSFDKLTKALRDALPPEVAEQAIREFKATFQAGFDENDPAMIDAAEGYFGIILEEAQAIRKADEGSKIAISIAEAFTKTSQKDAMSKASFEFMSAMEKGITEGGAKAEKAVETAVGKWATAMKGKLPDDILQEKIATIMRLSEQAWATGDEGLLEEIRQTAVSMEEEARAIERSDAITKAFQGLGDKISSPDVLERFRRSGENLTAALATAIEEGTPKSIAAAVKMGEDLVAQLGKVLPPEEAIALGRKFSEALKRAIEEGTPEALAALAAVQNEMGNALRASQLPTDARNMMQKVADNLASAEFKTKAGAAAADMMDAVRDRIREKTPQTEAEIVKAATAMGEKWRTELKPEQYAEKMNQLWVLVEAAITTGSAEALDALMKFFLGSEKAWDDYNKAIGAKAAATPTPAAQPPPPPPANTYQPPPPPPPVTYGGQQTPPNSNFGSTSVTPTGGKTPAGSAVTSKTVKGYTSGSTNYVYAGYGIYGEGGRITQPTYALLGENGETEYVIPESKVDDPQFLASIGLVGPEGDTIPGALHHFMVAAKAPGGEGPNNDWIGHLPERIRGASRALAEMGVEADDMLAYLKQVQEEGDGFNEVLDAMPKEAQDAAYVIGEHLAGATAKYNDALEEQNGLMEELQAITADLPGHLQAMVAMLVEAGAPLDALGNFLQMVNTQGDYMNDWVMHLPEQMRGFTIELGKLAATFQGNVSPNSVWMNDNPFDVINPITGELIKAASYPEPPMPEPPPEPPPPPSPFQTPIPEAGGEYGSTASAWRASGLSQEEYLRQLTAQREARAAASGLAGAAYEDAYNAAYEASIAGAIARVIGSSVEEIIDPWVAKGGMTDSAYRSAYGDYGLIAPGMDTKELADALVVALHADPLRAYVTQSELRAIRVDSERRGFITS